MNKTTIIEAQNSDTIFEEGKSKGILGKLKGVFADYKNGTRNGGRLYTEELWDNRVFNSEDVMEALETKTLFGELDHPDGDRCETLAQNAAITITKLEKRPEEGVIYGEAEILDTPTGRIVKALADSGAKLGISSRGMGEEIYENGQNIIDPDTYDFITFDVVVTPANTKARVALSESKHLDKMLESVKNEISKATTENQLNQIKSVVESLNLSKKEEVLDLIDEKLEEDKEVIEEKEDVKSKIQEANDRITINYLNKKVEQLEKLNAQLEDEKQFYKESRELLQSKLKENKQIIEENKEELEESKKELEENKTFKTNTETLINYKKMTARKIETMENKYKEEIAKLNEARRTANRENFLLDKEIKSLKEDFAKNENKLSKILLDNEKLLKENKELQLHIDKQTSKLTENKKLEETKIQEMQKEINKLQEANERLSKLSFNPIGMVEALNQKEFNFNMTQEDQDLYNALLHK